MNSNQQKEIHYLRYFQPIIDALIKLGGSGRAAEVEDIVAEQLDLSEAERNELTSRGEFRFRKEIDVARYYLGRAGLIDSLFGDIWRLTENGKTARLTPAQACDLYDRIHKEIVIERQKLREKK